MSSLCSPESRYCYMVSSNAMTQQLQDEFDSSVENAEAWMKAIQERLRINDNTKGPRSALEARLRETEKICALEPEGSLKMDLILVKADAALRSISEDKKREVLSKLRHIKALWEETAIYITHCHSRIEWVWLHWSEYLKAQDEFYAWIHNMRVTLEPDIELQLGLKEKQWQLSHAQVLLNDVLNQSVLLERLLEEAASLFNRIGDPSVDEDVQNKMRVEYEGIREEAQATRAVLAAEESTIERLKAQLKDLLQFSQDVQPHAESVVSAIRDYQSVRGKTSKMSTDTETQLRKLFQNPLQDFEQWKPSVQMLLESPEPLLAQIEVALAESSQFKEKLMTLQLKKDLLNNILGEEKAKAFLAEVAEASKEREILHKSLLQTKSKLQNLISQHKDFDAGFAPLQKKLSAIKAKLDLENEPQPNLLGKKTQLQRLQMIQDDLAELAIQMEEVEKLVQSNTTHRHEMNQLSSDAQAVKRSLEIMIQQTEEHVQKHWAFNDKLSDLQQWITATTEKISSYQGADGEQSTESRMADLERWLAEFPDKEIQLHLVEAHGQLVMENSSPEETAHVQAELDQLKESWRSLKEMATGLFKRWQLNRPVADKKRKKIAFVDSRHMSGPAFRLLDPNHKQERIEQNTSSHLKLLHDFEEWLQGENAKLSKILAATSSSTEEIKARHKKLEELQARVPDGQRRFEDLLHLHPVIGDSEGLEDLRYRWMLYKSQLKEYMSLPSMRSSEEPDKFRKKRSGVCSFLHRVCWAALPLQLLLLFLLLLAFLLPLVEDTHSCTLANNFARSFNLMLRYEGPPPT
ncbi:nesprin-3 isoform X5 [Oxyura jamaicensis]|uniref:nesprin-3 isoform X5 n=1 Tax=Oxyura jamaicensis TaxID=8884 RepID=UPI0015A53F69|nr:nesprin-3 isoform X5 [Oxyura jamaicensis]